MTFVAHALTDTSKSRAPDAQEYIVSAPDGEFQSTNTGDIAAALTAHPGGRYDLDTETFVASTLKGQRGKGGGGIGPEETLVTHPLTSEGADASEDGTGRGTPLVAMPLSHGSNPNSNAAGRRREDDFNLVAETVRSHPRPGSNSNGNIVTAFHMLQDPISEPELTPAWGKGNKEGSASLGVQQGVSVRRLTPTECERLQGLPDGWTAPEELGGPADYVVNDKGQWRAVGGGVTDNVRYAGLGDAVTATVGEWLGRRILVAESARVGATMCALKDGTPDEYGHLTCDRCQHCTKPFLLEDFCPEITA